LSVRSSPFSYPAHFLSAAKENERYAGPALAGHPMLAKLGPSPLRASGPLAVARKVKIQNIQNLKSLLLALITASGRQRFFLPKIKKH
jgi:hypothetical protein